MLGLVEKRASALEHVVVDTPGQIEIFTWSASGQLVSEARPALPAHPAPLLPTSRRAAPRAPPPFSPPPARRRPPAAQAFSAAFPTCILYVLDTPRSLNPQTFMSNMLQARRPPPPGPASHGQPACATARQPHRRTPPPTTPPRHDPPRPTPTPPCPAPPRLRKAVSILYKMQLPMVLVFNKCDVTRHAFAAEWMRDFEAFHAALEESGGYSTDLSRSLSLVLDEFYANVRPAHQPARRPPAARGGGAAAQQRRSMLPDGICPVTRVPPPAFSVRSCGRSG